ncbi:hypothetical protein MTP99_008073 [Tenebrio molitor]|nr:hypothetical protein MTP99_008073 [Tenebrio molitor]
MNVLALKPTLSASRTNWEFPADEVIFRRRPGRTTAHTHCPGKSLYKTHTSFSVVTVAALPRIRHFPFRPPDAHRLTHLYNPSELQRVVV